MKNFRNNLKTALMVGLVFMPALVFNAFPHVHGIQYVMVGLMIGVLGVFLFMFKKK